MQLRDKLILAWMFAESALLFFIGWQFKQIKEALIALMGNNLTGGNDENSR